MFSTTQAAPFVYRPLRHPREIRVIRLAAHPDVVLSLEHRNLDDKPVYTAVSYRWGTEAAEDDLIVEGRALRVRKRLKSMIEALKDEHSVRLLWIDAICIQQNSTNEQNHQVRLMGEIYSRADQVIAYLEGAPLSTWRVRGQSVYSKLAERAHRLGISKPLSQHTRDRLRPEPFLPVLSDEYFSRRWIIQEFCLARTVEFHFRGGRFTLEEFQRLLQQNRQASFTRRAATLCKLRNTLTDGPPTLEQLLYDFEDAACSQYQDIVYALMSLTRQVRLNLQVDYTLDRLELLVAVVQTCAAYENLPSRRTMSFASFLYPHLGISWDGLYRCIQRQGFTTLADNTVFEACAVLRADLASFTDFDDVYKRDLSKFRHHCPSMLRYAPIRLKNIPGEPPVLSTEDVQATLAQDTHVVFSGDCQHGVEISTSSDQLWSFKCRNVARAKAPDHYSRLTGFSNYPIAHGDQAWQFPRTPLALILRPVADGYIMIGRAQLLRTGMFIKDFDAALDWITDNQDVTIEQRPAIRFSIDAFQMLQLLSWVNLDQSLSMN